MKKALIFGYTNNNIYSYYDKFLYPLVKSFKLFNDDDMFCLINKSIPADTKIFLEKEKVNTFFINYKNVFEKYSLNFRFKIIDFFINECNLLEKYDILYYSDIDNMFLKKLSFSETLFIRYPKCILKQEISENKNCIDSDLLKMIKNNEKICFPCFNVITKDNYKIFNVGELQNSDDRYIKQNIILTKNILSYGKWEDIEQTKKLAIYPLTFLCKESEVFHYDDFFEPRGYLQKLKEYNGFNLIKEKIFPTINIIKKIYHDKH